jgi:hypothetical protein
METLKKDPFAVIPEVVIGNPFSLRTATWIPACAGMTNEKGLAICKEALDALH